MTASVLVKGTLLHAPESRTLKNGGLCVKATLKGKDGDYARFWHILAFDEAVQAALLRLSDGDAVAVQGSLKAELHDRNGETALSFGVIAERAQLFITMMRCHTSGEGRHRWWWRGRNVTVGKHWATALTNGQSFHSARWPESGYAGYRFPPEIIQQAIWLYLRLTQIFRER